MRPVFRPARKLLVLTLAGILLTCGCGKLAPAPLSREEKTALVMEYIEAVGMREELNENLKLQLSILRQNPLIAKDFMDRFEQRLDQEELIRRVSAVYYDHFSDEELREMVAFCMTPVGKKLRLKNLELTRMAAEIGEEYGREVGEAVAAEMKANGDN